MSGTKSVPRLCTNFSAVNQRQIKPIFSIKLCRALDALYERPWLLVGQQSRLCGIAARTTRFQTNIHISMSFNMHTDGPSARISKKSSFRMISANNCDPMIHS
jgi:hypothetical protein